MSRLTARKSLKSIQDQIKGGQIKGSNKITLKRSLTAAQLVSLGIGCIIGAGIFVMTGSAAANYAGPALILSFVLAGTASALTALCYAELAAAIPVSGSAYTYTYFSLGELLAWVVGWCLVLEYGVAASTVAVGWSGYVVSFLHNLNIDISPIYTQPTGTLVTLADGSYARALFNAPAFLGILLVTIILVIGVSQSAKVTSFMVFVKLTVIIMFIAIGVFYVNPDNWHPFIPESQGPGKFGMGGILAGAAYIFFAYIGFDSVATASQEAKNPQRDMPIGIIGSLTICTILYILVVAVLTGIVPYQSLNVPDPIAVAVDSIGLPWLAIIVKIGAIMGLSSVMLVLTFALVRTNFAMGEDGLLPKAFSTLHHRFRTPYITTIICGIIIAVAAALTPITTLGHLVSMGTLTAFCMVCIAVLYLRHKQPKLKRPFRCPGVPYVPVAGIACCLYLISGLPKETFVNFGVWLTAGLVIYFLYGIRKSKLA